MDGDGHLGDLVLVELSAADKKAAQVEILRVIEQMSASWVPVSSGSTNLLVIGVDRVTDVVMKHEAHIWFVNAHAKGCSGHNDLNIVCHERCVRCIAIATI